MSATTSTVIAKAYDEFPLPNNVSNAYSSALLDAVSKKLSGSCAIGALDCGVTVVLALSGGNLHALKKAFGGFYNLVNHIHTAVKKQGLSEKKIWFQDKIDPKKAISKEQIWEVNGLSKAEQGDGWQMVKKRNNNEELALAQGGAFKGMNVTCAEKYLFAAKSAGSALGMTVRWSSSVGAANPWPVSGAGDETLMQPCDDCKQKAYSLFKTAH